MPPISYTGDETDETSQPDTTPPDEVDTAGAAGEGDEPDDPGPYDDAVAMINALHGQIAHLIQTRLSLVRLMMLATSVMELAEDLTATKRRKLLYVLRHADFTLRGGMIPAYEEALAVVNEFHAAIPGLIAAKVSVAKCLRFATTVLALSEAMTPAQRQALLYVLAHMRAELPQHAPA